jgi:nucleoside-diphosphate-sugar epimerase
MRVLVTGNNGYIGTVMVPMLVENGFDVVGFDSDLFETCTFGDENTSKSMQKTPYFKKDIRDADPSDFSGFDAVVHLAALSNDPLGNFNPSITYEINYEASVKLARLAKKAGVKRFVFSSSCSVYGASSSDMVNEKSELNPVTPYGISKVKSEKGISQLADSEFSPTFMRSATAYGVSPMLRFDLVLNNLVAWAYTKGVVFLKSDGSAWRPIVHAEDFSRAFMSVLKAPRDLIHNEVFNVGRTDQNFRIRAIADIVRETVPGSKIEYAEGAEPDMRSYRVDFSKIAHTLTEFKPEWNARLGAKQLYDTFRKVGLLLKDFEGPRYRRIIHLENAVHSGVLTKTLRKRST